MILPAKGFDLSSRWIWASLIAQLVKNPPAIQETPVWFLGQEHPLEKGLFHYSTILTLSLWLRWSRICLQCGRSGFHPWVGKIPWRRERDSYLYWITPTPVFWPEEFHGLRPWGRRVRYDWMTFTFIFHGEGNGSPLQYSCLKNPPGQRSLVGYSPWGHESERWLRD